MKHFPKNKTYAQVLCDNYNWSAKIDATKISPMVINCGKNLIVNRQKNYKTNQVFIFVKDDDNDDPVF